MSDSSPALVNLKIDGREVSVTSGTTVAAAIMMFGVMRFRRSVTGEPRGPLCGMGICYECRVTIDGRAHSKSCQVPCRDGMDVKCDE
jgi:predicted molibdopterin-dependent oxidoreductase YjgC